MTKHIKYDTDEIMKAIFNPNSHTYNEENFNELIDELKQLIRDLGDAFEQTDKEEMFWIMHTLLNITGNLKEE
jgi:hypothetical protein